MGGQKGNYCSGQRRAGFLNATQSRVAFTLLCFQPQFTPMVKPLEGSLCTFPSAFLGEVQGSSYLLVFSLKFLLFLWMFCSSLTLLGVNWSGDANVPSTCHNHEQISAVLPLVLKISECYFV